MDILISNRFQKQFSTSGSGPTENTQIHKYVQSANHFGLHALFARPVTIGQVYCDYKNIKVVGAAGPSGPSFQQPCTAVPSPDVPY